MKLEEASRILEKNDWLVGGDFNEIHTLFERDDRGPFDQESVEEFNTTLQHLTELEANGGFHTWLNGFGPSQTCSKVDRMFGNEKWIAKWWRAQLILLNGIISDHSTLYLELIKLQEGSKPFYFFNS